MNLPRLSELIPWSIWEYLPKTAMGSDVFLIGGNPFQYRAYAAWHVKPLGTIEHTKTYRVKKAICDNEIGELEEVLNEGFDLETILDQRYPYTPLTLSAALNRSNITSYLLLRGANLEAKDGKGQTALMRATTFWQVESLLTLLSYGANPYTKDKYGFDCLEKARMRGQKAVETLLKDKFLSNDSSQDSSRANPTKFLLRFNNSLDSAFHDSASELFTHKSFLKSRFTPYPFNDTEGNYQFIFSSS